jgi:hypothetical protein
MPFNDDPPAPYKVLEGDELRGTYATRAEARRRQQLESQAGGSEPRHVVIKDDLDQVVCDPTVVLHPANLGWQAP